MLSVAAHAAAFVQFTLHEVGVSAPPSSCALNRTLHLFRHAEGWHNIDELEAEKDELHKRHPLGHLRAKYGIAWVLLKEVSGEQYLDPLLTPVGREQAYALRTRLRSANVSFDAVALSPTRRTMQTALFGLPQLEAAVASIRLDDPRSGHTPVVAPPLHATDLLRERCAHFMPDRRLTRTELEREFGQLASNATIDFSEVPGGGTPVPAS